MKSIARRFFGLLLNLLRVLVKPFGYVVIAKKATIDYYHRKFPFLTRRIHDLK